MTTELSKVAAAIKPSATLSLKSEIARVESAYGVKIIDLTAGQPDIGPTPDVLQALADGGKLHKYGPIPGEAGLRPLIAEVTTKETGTTFTADQIVVCVGAKGAIDCIMRAILDPGEAVAIMAPFWVTYPEVVAINGGVPSAHAVRVLRHLFIRPLAVHHRGAEALEAVERRTGPDARCHQGAPPENGNVCGAGGENAQ